MQMISFKLNKPLKDKKQGDIIKLECDENKIPIDHYWRRRLKDSLIDNCIEIVENDNQNVFLKKDKKEAS